jgi:hypothetical protein
MLANPATQNVWPQKLATDESQAIVTVILMNPNIQELIAGCSEPNHTSAVLELVMIGRCGTTTAGMGRDFVTMLRLQCSSAGITRHCGRRN